MTEVKDTNKSKERIDNIKFFIYVAILFLILRTFVFSTAKVNQMSMQSTFFQNNIVIFEKLSSLTRNYKVGDIVIFKEPETKKHLIKRVIALEGDTVEIKDGKVYVNDVQIVEDYLDEGVTTMGQEYLRDNTEITIEEGKIFVLGDNRGVSYDSRGFGPIDKKSVNGTVKFKIFPFNKMKYYK